VAGNISMFEMIVRNLHGLKQAFAGIQKFLRSKKNLDDSSYNYVVESTAILQPLKALAISVQSNATGTRATSRLRLAAARNIFKNEAAVFQVAAYTTQTWAANTPYA
jgi:hypothetical protein